MLSMYRSKAMAIGRSSYNSLVANSNTNSFSMVCKAKNTNTNTTTRLATRAKSTTTTTTAANESFAKRNPFAFQLLVATGKTSAADLVVQVVAERKKLDEIDWKRNGIFVVFGFAYLGGFQWWLMVTKYRQWFPTMDRFAKLTFAQKLKDTAGIIDAAKMVVFDVVVHLPMIYFPTYYTVKEFVSMNSYNPVDWVKDGVTKYAGNAKEDLTAMIKLWGPSDCVQFVLPLHIRMPFRHMVSFFWTAYVSFTRGAIEDTDTDSDTADVEKGSASGSAAEGQKETA